MVRLLVSLLGARGEAEDVAQEAFTKAYLGLARYRNDGPIRAWLRVIATREAFNARRKTRERVLDDPDRRPDVGAPDPGFDGLMARDTVLTVLERMPYAWREALVLRHVEEMEIGELAALWETSPAAVKMRLTRARQRFAEIHAGLDGEPDGALAR
jgi:RNA polymerase sigma-70 factor (ECF subfamily)